MLKPTLSDWSPIYFRYYAALTYPLLLMGYVFIVNRKLFDSQGRKV